MADPYLLLPPSEGKAAGGNRRRQRGSFPQLSKHRASVLEALVAACDSAAASAKVLGVRGELLDRALDALTDLAAGSPPMLPAWERYTGVVWEHFRAHELPDDARARIVVPNALLGLVTGTDPVPDHRLKFSVSLPGIGGLAAWWRADLTDALLDHLDGAAVIDLLPKEHAAAIDWKRLAAAVEVTRVRFVAHDGRRAAGHAAKAAKGHLAHRMTTGGPAAALRFRWQGWRAARDGDDIVVHAPPPEGLGGHSRT